MFEETFAHLANILVIHADHRVVYLGHEPTRARRRGVQTIHDVLVEREIIISNRTVLVNRHIHVTHDFAHFLVLVLQLFMVAAQLVVFALHALHLLELPKQVAPPRQAGYGKGQGASGSRGEEAPPS